MRPNESDPPGNEVVGVADKPPSSLVSPFLVSLFPLQQDVDWWPDFRWPLWRAPFFLFGGPILLGVAEGLSGWGLDGLWETLAIYGALLAGFMLMMKRYAQDFLCFSGLSNLGRMSDRWRTLCLTVGLALCIAFLTQMTYQIRLWPVTPSALQPHAWSSQTVALVLVNTSLEGIIVLGYLLGALLPRVGPHRAIVVVGLFQWLLSTLLYVSTGSSPIPTLVGMFYIFLTSCLLAWYQLRVGSIYGCIVAYSASQLLLLTMNT